MPAGEAILDAALFIAAAFRSLQLLSVTPASPLQSYSAGFTSLPGAVVCPVALTLTETKATASALSAAPHSRLE